MLDRFKLIKEFSKIRSKLFPDKSSQINLAKKIWQEISKSEMFPSRVLASHSSFLIPGWKGNLDDAFDVDSKLSKYCVLAVDGSQIYPDRNAPGSGCFLINVGGALFEYGQKSSVDFFSDPYVFVVEDFKDNNLEFSFSKDLIDLRREEFELQIAFETAFEKLSNKNVPAVCLFDGSLIFWHLESKSPDTKNLFLDLYLSNLEKFYEEKILIAGYISYPKSKELVNLIKLGLCRFSIADCISCHKKHDSFPCKQADYLLDTHVARFFLKKHQRTTLFTSNSKIIENYPDHLKPHFFILILVQKLLVLKFPLGLLKMILMLMKFAVLF